MNSRIHPYRDFLWLFAFILPCIMLSSLTYAASFDCSYQLSPIEEMICTNQTLSMKDEELAQTYRSVQKNNDNFMLKQEQRHWLQQRQSCLAVKEPANCLMTQYQERIRTLKSSTIAETPALCKSIAGMVTAGTALSLEPKEYVDNPPRGKAYTEFDIDSDGQPDSVTTGCGSGECLLDVKMTTGKEYDVDDLPFIVIQYHSSFYALVSMHDEPNHSLVDGKSYLLRLYHITENSAVLVCGRNIN